MTTQPKHIALAGASGLIGRALLEQLLAAPAATSIQAPSRTPLRSHPKLYNPNGEFLTSIAALNGPIDIAFCCLGTTMAQAKSQEAFFHVDFTLVQAFSERVKALGAKHFIVVSAMGANSQSRFFYNRVKGQMQEMLIAQEFEQLTIAQPALLLGQRKNFRLIESLSAPLAKCLPANYRAIAGTTVARALWRLALEPTPGVRVVKSKALREQGLG